MPDPEPVSADVDVPVDTLSEEWSEYRLGDGTLLRAKTVILKVLWPRDANAPSSALASIQVGGTQLLGVFAPPEVRGPAGAAFTLEELSLSARLVAPFDVVREPWNMYRIAGDRGFVKVRTTVTHAERVVDRFDPSGQPVYFVNYGVIGGQSTREEVERSLATLAELARRPISSSGPTSARA